MKWKQQKTIANLRIHDIDLELTIDPAPAFRDYAFLIPYGM